MALSIGACTAVFSIVNAVLIRPLPYPDGERMVVLWHTVARQGAGVIGMSAGNYVSYRDNTRSFETLGAATTRGYNLSTVSAPIRVTCARTTANLLPMLGIPPAAGRWFTASDDKDGAEKTVILSHDLWRTHFAGDPHVLGKTVSLDLNAYTVIGIMPEPFRFPSEGVDGLESPSCIVPASFSATEIAMPAFNIVVFGKLKQGVGVRQAAADTSAVTKSILESYPAAVQKDLDLRSRIVPLREQVTSSGRPTVLILSAAVAFLLLIGCVNVANLALVRLQNREREFAIRTALGSTRFGLVRQTLTECIFLSLCGGVVGMFVAWQMLELVIVLNPGNLPRLKEAHLDLIALAFTFACSVAAGALIGLLPSIRMRISNVAASLAEGSRGASTGPGGMRIRNALVALETAVTLVLLIGSALLLRSFTKLSNVPPGFSPDRLLTFSIALPADKYQQAAQVNAFVRRVLERVHSLPSVIDATAGSSLPIGDTTYAAIARPDAPAAVSGFKVAALQIVTPEYHAALGIALMRGRRLQAGDTESALPVAVVNETMAKRYWPDKDALGERFSWIALTGPRTLTIVGVAADVHQTGLNQKPVPLFYIPINESPQPVRNLLFAIKTAASPDAIARSVQRILGEIDPEVPAFAMQPATEILSKSIARERFSASLVAVFAVIAIILAALGIYAVIGFIVGNSTREIGIRIALGGGSASILLMVLGRGLAWVGIGLVTGIGVALVLTRYMASLLFEIKTTDVWTFVLVSGMLLAISAIAILIPARRATQVDPMLSLRQS
jgi:putative ABC transport system permease protein